MVYGNIIFLQLEQKVPFNFYECKFMGLKVNCLPAKEIRDSIYLASAMMTETDVNQLLPCLVKNDNNLEFYNCPNRKFIVQ